MKVLFFDDTLNIYLIPSVIPEIGDNLVLTLRNEMTNELFTPDFEYILNTTSLQITLLEQLSDFRPNNKYSIVLKNGLNTIYIGKMICLESGTNIQNYEYGSQTTKRFEYK